MWGILIPSGCIQTYLWGSHRSTLLLGHWELFGELCQFCNIKPCQIIKKMTKYMSLFLWLTELSREKLCPPSRGDPLQSSLTEWPLLHKKNSDTHTPVALCSDACLCFPMNEFYGGQWSFQAKAKAANFLLCTILCHTPHGFEGIQQTNCNREWEWNCVGPKSNWSFPAQWHSASDALATNLSFLIWQMEIIYLWQSLLR